MKAVLRYMVVMSNNTDRFQSIFSQANSLLESLEAQSSSMKLILKSSWAIFPDECRLLVNITF